MISYMGGKSIISKFIIKYIPKDIQTYVEPFGGMFWNFFKMDLSEFPNLRTVVYNDFNKLNSNLFKCTKQYDKLWDEIDKYSFQEMGVDITPPEHKELFNTSKKEIFSPNLTIKDSGDFEIAVKYIIVLCQLFSGSRPEIGGFVDLKGKYKSKVLTFKDKLKKPAFRKQIDNITFVENNDFSYIINKYDDPFTFFYVDPPYYNLEDYYSKHDFGRPDHLRLSNELKDTEGRWALSYYYFTDLEIWFPKDEYRWATKEFSRLSSATKGKSQTKAEEILIMNY